MHFSQADKGGAIVLADPVVVNEVILSELQNPSKYVRLNSDPRHEIESNLLELCKSHLPNKGLTQNELFLITGHTDNGGKTHNPLFSAGKPNPFPLFKLHSMSAEDLANKVTPPYRLVTSMKFGPTKRPALFLDSVLTPVSVSYCGSEYLKDTPHFLNKLADYETQLCAPGVSLVTLDVKALYPSIDPNMLPFAVEAALDTVSDFSAERKKFIVDLVKFSINNGVTHYRGDWYLSILGIPTGASDSVCLANIYMRWVLIKFFATFPHFKELFVCYSRFIDDLFGGWAGSVRQFYTFIYVFNGFGKRYGIIFDKEQIGDTVHNLDVSVSNATGELVTDLYTKPTDAHRYLHRNSFHPQHTFRGIPFSQMRRAVIICSTPYLRDIAIGNIIKYLLECNYKLEHLEEAKSRALQLDRKKLLDSHRTPPTSDDSQPLCFVLPFSPDVSKIRRLVFSLLG